MRGAPETVVADLGAAAWQDVLEEPLEKRDAGEGDPARLVRPIVLIAKRHVVIAHLLHSAVRDRDAEDIPPEIIEDALAPTGRLRMHDPRRRPRRGGHLIEQPRATKGGAHFRTEDDRQRPHGHDLVQPATGADGRNVIQERAAHSHPLDRTSYDMLQFEDEARLDPLAREFRAAFRRRLARKRLTICGLGPSCEVGEWVLGLTACSRGAAPVHQANSKEC